MNLVLNFWGSISQSSIKFRRIISQSNIKFWRCIDQPSISVEEFKVHFMDSKMISFANTHVCLHTNTRNMHARAHIHIHTRKTRKLAVNNRKKILSPKRNHKNKFTLYIN